MEVAIYLFLLAFGLYLTGCVPPQPTPSTCTSAPTISGANYDTLPPPQMTVTGTCLVSGLVQITINNGSNTWKWTNASGSHSFVIAPGATDTQMVLTNFSPTLNTSQSSTITVQTVHGTSASHSVKYT